jgi:hypothetical protein
MFTDTKMADAVGLNRAPNICDHFSHHSQRKRMPLRPPARSGTRHIQHLNFIFLGKPNNRGLRGRLSKQLGIQHHKGLLLPLTKTPREERPTRERPAIDSSLPTRNYFLERLADSVLLPLLYRVMQRGPRRSHDNSTLCFLVRRMRLRITIQ